MGHPKCATYLLHSLQKDTVFDRNFSLKNIADHLWVNIYVDLYNSRHGILSGLSHGFGTEGAIRAARLKICLKGLGHVLRTISTRDV